MHGYYEFLVSKCIVEWNVNRDLESCFSLLSFIYFYSARKSLIDEDCGEGPWEAIGLNAKANVSKNVLLTYSYHFLVLSPIQ